MIYVALLRGINVGGKNKIDMKQLRVTFENIGMNSVTTYINSGNIIFSDKTHTQKKLESLLGKAVHHDFGLEIKVLLLNINELSIIINTLPDNWKDDKYMKCNVLFLWGEIDDKTILNKIAVKHDIDKVVYVPGAVLWAVEQKKVTKSGLMKLAGTDVYKNMTIRNVNTTRKMF